MKSFAFTPPRLLTCLLVGALFGVVTSSSYAQPAAVAQAAKEPSKEAAADEDDDDEPGEKYNFYVKAYNSLNQMFYGSTKGMPELLDKYKSQRLSQRSGGGKEPTRYMNTSMLRNYVEALRRGVALKNAGPYAELEAVAKRIVGNGLALHKVSQEYDDYLDSKKFLDDGYERGRALDGPFVQGWEALINDHDALGQAITKAERAMRIAAVARERKEGEHLMAATREAMLVSSDLIDLFPEAKDFKDAARTKEGDVLLIRLETLVKEIRERAPTHKGDALRHTYIADYMTRIVGYYRSLKNSMFPKASEFQDMIEKYNSAVRQMDRIDR